MAESTGGGAWYTRIPHPIVLVFGILVLAWVATWLVPAGSFEREVVDGRNVVVPGTYAQVESQNLSPLEIVFAIPRGMVAAASIIFITFIAGGLFRLLEKTGALENMVGTLVRKLGQERQILLIWLMMFVFGFLGATVGFENNIALVPIAVLLGRAIGGDIMIGAALAVGGIGFGFATSPINPYTVGTSHMIAELPLFSGAVMRTLLCISVLAIAAEQTTRYLKRVQRDKSRSLVSDIEVDESQELSKPLSDYSLSARDGYILATFAAGLALIIFGVFVWGWYIQEIAGIFLGVAIISGIIARMDANTIVKHMLAGASAVTGGAMIIGVARAIQVMLDDGQIADTIVYALATPLQDLPVVVSSVLMTMVHSVINFLIPSGSGQAMATMPIMVPLSDVVGMTRQTAVLAFQVGDGLTNLLVPTSGGTLAMLALAGVPYDRWLRFAFPLVLKAFVVSWIFLAIAAAIQWGPA